MSMDIVDAEAVDLDAVDLTDPRLYRRGTPHHVFAALRRERPVRWQETEGGSGFWSVTQHADCTAVLADAQTFTSENGTLVSMLDRFDPASRSQMAVTDPPRHTALRVPISGPLRQKAMAAHAEALRAEIRRLLAPAAEGEELDFAAAMMSLSTAVAGLVMGLPAADWPELTRLATTAIAPDDPEYALPQGREATLHAAHWELFAYFHEQAQQRRGGGGGDDLISVLDGIELDGERLSIGDIVANCYSLLMGASVTSPHVPSSTVLELVGSGRYPAWARRDALAGSAIEEALRWSSPANHFMRCATRDAEIGGVKVAAGQAVVVWIGSANRDESVFPDAFRYDPGRRPNNHLAFGAGPHYCVGHHAARQTLRLLFAELTATFADLEIVGPVVHLESNFVAGIKHLRVRGARPQPGRRWPR